jgi:hypothetical protein
MGNIRKRLDKDKLQFLIENSEKYTRMELSKMLNYNSGSLFEIAKRLNIKFKYGRGSG